MRLRKIPQAAAYLEQAANVITLDERIVKQLDNKAAQTVALEIGCGKGDFSIARATKNTETQYYALEKYDSVLLKAVQKAELCDLANLTFVLGDAADLAQLFAPKSLSKIYLNFSDPWPKKRHAKRRLTYRSKLAIYEQLLKAGGRLELKTDNPQLFASSLEELTIAGWDIHASSVDLYGTDAFAEVKAYRTEYEKKFIAAGKPIHYLQAGKTEGKISK